jgi:hypothetical protein
MQIKELKNSQEISAALVLIEKILEIDTKNQEKNLLIMMENGYKMAGIFDQNNCLGVAGIKTEVKLFQGKILEVEDFALDENCDKKVGDMLIGWIEQQAKILECNEIICSIESKRFEFHKIFSLEKYILEGFKFRKII